MAIATETRLDREIHQDVLAELKWDPRIQPNEIGVIVKDGIVTLTGRVGSYLKKWAAEDAAHRVRGVKAVANDIEVAPAPASERTDDEIAAAAVRALEWDALLPAEKLKVTVSNGWVTLRGTVEWQYEREDAERVVRRLIGVKGVTNLIVVNPTIKPKELKRTVEEALKRNAHITDPSSIAVDVDNTKVILKGKVRTWEEREEAEQTAWRAHGVTDVDNRLMITFGLLGL